MNRKLREKRILKRMFRAALCIIIMFVAFIPPFTSLAMEDDEAYKNAIDESKETFIQQAIIGIDPCNQQQADIETESIYPTAERQTWKMDSGTIGVKTGVPEYQLNLIIANKVMIKFALAQATVDLTREENNVNISNAQRAGLMNDAGVDLWIRISCNSSPDSSQRGIVIKIPSRAHAANIYAESLRLARDISNSLSSVVKSESITILAYQTQAAFNYSQKPVVDVGVGYLTNPQDDVSLNRERYIDDIANAIFEGIKVYFARVQIRANENVNSN